MRSSVSVGFTKLEFLILGLLVKSEEGLSGLGMVKSNPRLLSGTIYNLLRTLVSKGYIRSRPDNKGLYVATPFGKDMHRAIQKVLNDHGQ